MPFLRRRGDLASESDMRRHTQLEPDSNPAQVNSDPAPSQPSQPHDTHSTTKPDEPIENRDPPSVHDDDDQSSQQESRASTVNRPRTPNAHDESFKHRRFSLLRFRNASDSQLSVRAKQQAEKPPPVPIRPPEIITTAPTNDITAPKKRPSRINLANRFRRSTDIPREDMNNPVGPSRSLGSRTLRKSFHDETGRPSLATLEEPLSPRPPAQITVNTQGTALTTPAARQSESSRSDASSTDPTTPSTTPRKSQSSTSFFKLRRSKKTPEPLFGGLSHLPQKNNPASSTSLALTTNSARPSTAHDRPLGRQSIDKHDGSQRSRMSPAAGLFAPSGNRSGHSSPTRATLLRGRSSTMSSAGGRDSTDDHLLPPTTRTSSSTGRKSFGDLLGLSKLRHTDLSRQGTMTPLTPGSGVSQSNSLQLTRPTISLPEKRDDESPAKYLARVEEVIPRSLIAAMLSVHADSFSASVLRSYMRKFMFYGDPMDMAIRKLLMEAELPKETQHIDRCLQAFANRYDECNPGIYSSADQAYFAAFSLLILHTDVFNKNNKNKMQKAQYLKNTGGQGIFDNVLESFYDNITYTPFIHMEDNDSNSDRTSISKSKKKQLLVGPGTDPAKRALKEPIDPYLLILDNNLDALRPNLKEALPLEDCYNYLGTAKSLNLKDLQKTFFRTGVLQIVSARSRPEAFMSDKADSNVQDAGPGIVDIKITKVGLLWRKDAKKRKTRSPWQEWGAILTGAQLYFFRNVSWVKSLMHQYEHHIKDGNDGIPIIFKPPLEEFKPDTLMSTNGAVALVDTSYKKHKNAFLYVRQGGLDEVLLADNEEEMNDWLAKLNYAAAFRTSGVKMRGVIGGNYDGQGRRGIRRLDSSEATQLVQTPSGPVSIARSRIDRKMVEDMQTQRRDFLHEKINEASAKLEMHQKQLDEQLRNARHLQILAPIQPKTRADLLSAAARMAAQIKWTRIEIWKEKCHRDILMQDLEEDGSGSSVAATPTKPVSVQSPRERAASPTPTSGRDSKKAASSETSPRRPAEIKIGTITSATEPDSVESPLDQAFHTPPQSAIKVWQGSHDASVPDVPTARHGSVSSGPASPVQSPSNSRHQRTESQGDDANSIQRSEHGPDDVDAGERTLLKQAGLLRNNTFADSSDQMAATTSADSSEQVSAAEREKADKAKIRRSLQRTLREGAGHLSHHRSRKGKEVPAAGGSEGIQHDSMLSRGTGSFVVHGKKASVIDLGTELQSMSTDERLRLRTQVSNTEIPGSPPLLSPTEESDFQSALGDLRESLERRRRESAASASTATARSFRELHRKYSSAQSGARSISAGGRLTVPSDTESEAAVSFSDGRRSPLPPIEGDETIELLERPSQEESQEDCLGSEPEPEARDGSEQSPIKHERDVKGGGDGDGDGETSGIAPVQPSRQKSQAIPLSQEA
ncbi:hypothetical protein NLU13_1635 [Sarocladium strictum]|uniref:Protein transport protein sec73 n=1 Tax=Sarocladium strictum TaxID=5046 RepID=A0AA39GRC4_SARSR|nr:hypothetical protein NLU13_1635 [Sarocladium strictum]